MTEDDAPHVERVAQKDDENHRCPECERQTGVEREQIPDREFENDPSHIATHRCENCGVRFDPRSDSYIKWLTGWYNAQ